jgi:N-acetylmuramoyl-L-alanine amidase CwlA
MTKQEILNALSDAITASGKKFSEISKESVLSFLQKENVPQREWTDIYEKLSQMYQKQTQVDKKPTKTGVVDYSNSSHNDVKVREPRKTIFSDIKKIAG